jgi:hypothetical protein
MTKAISLLGIGVLTMFTACSAERTDRGQSSVHGTGSFPGAIFTTLEDGSKVNENVHYATCLDVYLNGGPKGGGPGLPEGDYYFMVTDPSGKTLLSNDAIALRMVHVDGSGEFHTYSGTHDTGTDINDGSLTVQLWPFDPTPNPGAEYKAWLTPVDAYKPGEGVHGFPHNASKTDNFKCDRGAPPPPPPDAGPPEEPPPECDDEDCPIR